MRTTVAAIVLALACSAHAEARTFTPPQVNILLPSGVTLTNAFWSKYDEAVRVCLANPATKSSSSYIECVNKLLPNGIKIEKK